MSQAYKCDRCGELFEINIITGKNKQWIKVARKRKDGDFLPFDLCGRCQNALLEFMNRKTFSPHEIGTALVIHGQSDLRFKLGGTIRYSPSEVENILKGENENG